jgi:hypothetical protein
MSLQPQQRLDLLPLRARLFAPGQRLGWVFRDRRQFAAAFMEPPPVPLPVHPRLVAQRHAADRWFRSTRRVAVVITIGLLAFFCLLAGCATVLPGTMPIGLAFVAVLLLAAPAIAATAVMGARRAGAVRAAERAGPQLAAAYQQHYAAWAQRKAAHERAEAARVDGLDEWGALHTPPGIRRIDVFGGSLHGWEAFLTVNGTSVLAERPMLVADFSRELVCRELALTASAAGAPVDVQLLPAQLASSTVLAGLAGQQLAQALAEAMHPGDSADDRTRRALDTRILTEVCAALAAPLSLARVAAALRAVMDDRADEQGEPSGRDEQSALSPAERAAISAGVFTAQYRRQVRADLVRIESYLHPLSGLGSLAGPPEPAYLTCIALQPAARNAGDELLGSLVLQWLTHHITTAAAQVPAVVIAGADELARRHLERLSDACERRGVLLTLLFRHLRADSVQLLGGGAAAFMRLGNHEEAARAADFIGRQHRFVLSQLTASIGGDQTHTAETSTGTTASDTITPPPAAGWLGRLGSAGLGGILGPAALASRLGQAGGTARTMNRTWSTAYARASGTNWSDAQSSQRVYEYAVEPTVLQHLPDYAMLLVASRPDGAGSLTPVECNPEIVTLPRVSSGPLPDLASSWRPPVGPPAWPSAWPPGAGAPSQPATRQVAPPAGQPPGYSRPPGAPQR